MTQNMEFHDAIEFANAVWPVARVVAPALFALGWISPAFPTRKRKNGRKHIDNDVIEKSNSLAAKIKSTLELGHFPKFNYIVRLAILDITRGAFIHRTIFNARANTNRKKLL